MVNVILNIIILIASIFEFYAVIKDIKSDEPTIKIHSITMISSIILAICWFIEVKFISIRLVPLAYILSFMNVFIVVVEFEYFKLISKSNKTSNDNYIDIEIDENKDTNVDNSNNNTIKTIEKH